MIGCRKSGNLCEEKNTPDKIHIGIMIRFIRPEAASMVCARDAINKPIAQKHSDPNTHKTMSASAEPRTGTPNTK